MAKVKDIRKELRGLKDSDLDKRLHELREKLRDLTFKTHADEVKNVHEMNVVKKDIARILTVMSEKRRINQVESN